MIQANTLYLAAMYADNMPPSLVDTKEDGTMYVGYCTPDCTSEVEKKWLIKKVQTDDAGIQRIFFSGGSRKFDKSWLERESITYKPTEGWTDKTI